jgi:transcriptional regulator with XRE-family HTH domain
MNIGNNLKKIRIIRGINREQMADALSICVKQYGNIENGITKLDVDRLIIAAKELNVDPGTILKFNDDDFLNERGLN